MGLRLSDGLGGLAEGEEGGEDGVGEGEEGGRVGFGEGGVGAGEEVEGGEGVGRGWCAGVGDGEFEL